MTLGFGGFFFFWGLAGAVAVVMSKILRLRLRNCAPFNSYF